MTKQEIGEKLHSVLESLDIHDIDFDSSFYLDSLDTLYLSSEIVSLFGVEIEEMPKSINNLIDLIYDLRSRDKRDFIKEC